MYIDGNFETVKSGKFCIYYTCSPNLVSHWLFRLMIIIEVIKSNNPVDTWRKLNVRKTFKRRRGRLLNVLCTFHLRHVSTGKYFTNLSFSVLCYPIYHSKLYYPISTSKLTTQTILIFILFFNLKKQNTQIILHSQIAIYFSFDRYERV